MNKRTILEATRFLGAQGGKQAAKNMTKAQRVARAKKAAAASAKVRSAKAMERRQMTKSETAHTIDLTDMAREISRQIVDGTHPDLELSKRGILRRRKPAVEELSKAERLRRARFGARVRAKAKARREAKARTKKGFER